MTIIAAVSFFDFRNRSMGYALGSETVVRSTSLESFENEPSPNYSDFRTEKSFGGRNSIGLVGGTLVLPAGEDNGLWEKSMRHLDGFFDAIQNGKRYRKPEIFAHEKTDVSVLVASRTNGSVALYSVREHPLDPKDLVARLLHRGSRTDLENCSASQAWCGPCHSGFRNYTLDFRFNPTEAQRVVVVAIQEMYSQEYPEDPNTPKTEDLPLYYLSPREHGRVENGRLTPVGSVV